MRLPTVLLALALGCTLAAAETCADRGLWGQCSGCTCCCSRGSLILRFVPSGCDCVRKLEVGDLAFVLAVSAVLLLPAFMTGLYFASGRAFAAPGGLPTATHGTPRTLAWTAAERRRVVA